MTLTALLNTPVTITRRVDSGEIDEYGGDIPDEETLETLGELQQRQSTEPGVDGEMSIADFLLILPAGTILTTADVVTVDGLNYEVVGAPWPVRNPRTQQASHVQATVRRTAGASDEGAS